VRGILLGLAILLVSAAPAAGQGTAPFDGSNPFNCVLQFAGFGTTVPDPGADPFCIEFDKRRQNFTELGIAEFLAQEPARVALASDKCFYFQHDHWTSSVVQGNQQTETYNWDGSYFFDKARGTGGAYVENFTFNNQTQDPRSFPGFPEEYKPFFGPGRGGMQFAESGVEFEPRCVELAKTKSVYAMRTGGAASGGSVGCLTGQGSISRGVPGARLGASRARVLGALGQPTRRRRGFMRWCAAGDGELIAGFARARSSGARRSARSKKRLKLRVVLSTAPVFDTGGVAAGDPAGDARRRLRGERTLRKGRRGKVLAVRGRGATRLVKIRARRVQWVGSAGRKLKKRRLLRLLARAG
jgi:hypothetical protein